MLKNKLLYLLFLIIAGFFSILYNEYFIGVIFLAAVILPVVLFGIVLYSSFKIKIKLDVSALTVEKDEYLNLIIYLKNKSAFPVSRMELSIRYYNEFSGIIKKEKIQLALDRNSFQNVSCQITSGYCGNMLFEIKSVKIYDYFHIWSVNKKVRQAVQVSVLPKIYEISGDIITENNLLLVDSDVYSEYKPGDDPSEVFGIREYREGDKPNRIHRKLSYKQAQLMVKEFSDPIKDSIVVLMDFNYGEKPERNALSRSLISAVTSDRPGAGNESEHEEMLRLTDGLLDCAMSVSYNLLLNEHIHKFAWYDKERDSLRQLLIKNKQASSAVFEIMLKTAFAWNGPSVLSGYARSIYKQNNTHMIYITSVLKEEEIYEWAESHKETLLYLLYVNHLDEHPVNEELKSLLQNLGITVYEIDINNIQESITAMGYI